MMEMIVNMIPNISKDSQFNKQNVDLVVSIWHIHNEMWIFR